MNNIRQITNFDISSANTVYKTIQKGGDSGEIAVDYPYKVITSDKLGSENVFKFGYCTNNNQGINYPIFLVLNGVETEFQIGKTGMFEFQPETWKDVNGNDTEREATVSLSSVLVPKDITFCIDYCYSI